jgi:hypothetical protein
MPQLLTKTSLRNLCIYILVKLSEIISPKIKSSQNNPLTLEKLKSYPFPF